MPLRFAMHSTLGTKIVTTQVELITLVDGEHADGHRQQQEHDESIDRHNNTLSMLTPLEAGNRVSLYQASWCNR
ncbi:hypothetical protein CKO42_10710 [Lamprobacter modestohalophilus]|uniref:Uncharacterized protein n=1 Tax=Lamprobacter modestohalophilus TaxID=1064514 RepID=A0A9X0W8I6_9GAMM|nr:hypothetical protein [Lamprobacter modestohalophilus]